MKSSRLRRAAPQAPAILLTVLNWLLNATYLIALVFLFIPAKAAWASGEWHVGGDLGYGGAGVVTVADVAGNSTSVSRAEAPGVATLFIEDQLTDTFVYGFEHSRGFRLGPFSSGVGFTGVIAKWFFSPAPSIAYPTEGESTVLIRRYAFYYGIGAGIAIADIYRDDDQVPRTQGSGAYYSFRFGADCLLRPGLGVRYEILSSSTFYSQGLTPQSLSEFALQAGLFFLL